MKRLLLLALLLTATAYASNYPADYCNQSARFATNGPVVFGRVESGCLGTKYIFGYKDNGILGNREYIDTVMVITCADNKDRNRYSVTKVLRLNREMHGNGYISEAIHLDSFCGDNYALSNHEIQFAFTNNNEWDSNYGRNYRFRINSGLHQTFKMGRSTSGSGIEYQVWDFIVGLLK
jgi:hypothetical protein